MTDDMTAGEVRPASLAASGDAPARRRLLIAFGAIMAVSLLYSYVLLFQQPVRNLFIDYSRSYIVARALYHFDYPYYPDLSIHDRIVRDLQEATSRYEVVSGEKGRYGSTKDVFERWLEQEPALKKMDPERVYLMRPFFYEMVVAAIWKILGRESYATVLVLGYVTFNLGVLLIVGYVLAVTRKISAAIAVSAFLFLYTPYIQFAQPMGLSMFAFPMSLGAGILLAIYLRSRHPLKQWLSSLGLGLLIGAAILTRTDELFWLPVLLLLWSALVIRELKSRMKWRPAVHRCAHLAVILAVIYVCLLPLLKLHEKHGGERFLSLGGWPSIVFSWRLIPDNPVGPPITAQELISELKEKGYYSGHEAWEARDLRDEVQSYNLDRAARRYALDLLKEHPLGIALEMLKRMGFLVVPYAYKRFDYGFYVAIPPSFSWKLIEPGQDGLYIAADTFQARRASGETSLLKRLSGYLMGQPIPALLRTYAYLVAPILACLGGMAALLTLWHPVKYAEQAIGLWFLAKAMFIVGVHPVASPYLQIAYASAFACGAVTLYAGTLPVRLKPAARWRLGAVPNWNGLG